MFWSNRPDGSADELAMHTGCPVVQGRKWTAIKWIHLRPFRPELFDSMPVGTLADAYNPNGEDGYNPSLCTDLHPQCKGWAASGECKVGWLGELLACVQLERPAWLAGWPHAVATP